MCSVVHLHDNMIISSKTVKPLALTPLTTTASCSLNSLCLSSSESNEVFRRHLITFTDVIKASLCAASSPVQGPSLYLSILGITFENRLDTCCTTVLRRTTGAEAPVVFELGLSLFCDRRLDIIWDFPY